MKEINKFWILFLLGFSIYILTDILSLIYFPDWYNVCNTTSYSIPYTGYLIAVGMIGISFGFYIGRNLDRKCKDGKLKINSGDKS